MKKLGFYALLAVSAFLLCCNASQAAEASLLRADSSCGWTERLETCQGSTFYLVVLPGQVGQATLNHLYPNGTINGYSYFFLGYDRLPMYADEPGRHVFSYVVAGKESNSVSVDVNACGPASYAPPRVSPPCPAPCSAPCPEPEPVLVKEPVKAPARFQPVSLSSRECEEPLMLEYYPIGSHLMNYQKGIAFPKYSSQYHFGRDFSLGTIDGNYPGTPFILQYLSDP